MRHSIHSNLKTIPKYFLGAAALFFLAACGIFSTPLPTASTMTPIDVAAISTQAAATAYAQFTATAANFTPSPIPPTLTIQSASTSSPTSLPPFPLDGYVMLFTRDGNLYFQDGDNTPVKLTHIDGKNYPFPPYFFMLSDDNQKVIYYQNDGNIYSISTDGAQEQVVIPNNWLDSLETGTYMGDFRFIPKTHILFFEAILCKEKSSISLCSTTIFLTDTNTGKIRKLADLGLALQHHDPRIQENITFSPNGKMLAVGTMEGVKVFTLDGKVIRQNILPYTPSKSSTPFPSLFWLPDSSGLIVAIPDKIISDPFYVGGAPAYTVWRYMLDNNSAAQIPFKPPVAGTFEVSPDGNWIVYGGISPDATELYLGNLADGGTKAFGNDDLRKSFQWSPDSKHFIHGLAVVISFDKPPLDGGAGPSWVDSSHFIYFDIPGNNPLIQKERFLIAEIRGEKVYYYELGLPYPGLIAIRPK